MKDQLTSVPSELTQAPAAAIGALSLYIASLAPGSRRAASWRLEQAAKFLGVVGPVKWSAITYADAVAIRAAAAETYAPRTASAIVGAVRAVVREAWKGGLLDGEVCRRIQSIAPVKGNSVPPGRYVSRLELRELLSQCVKGNAGARDAALLAILFGAGLRRSEAAALQVDDVEGAALLVKSGKGAKGRRVPIDAATLEAIERWRAQLDSGKLLRAVNKGDAVQTNGMTGEAIRRRLLTLCKRAGVKTFRPHDARRSYASALLDSGVDLAVVARLLGHASVLVTAGYDRRGARAEVEAAALVRFPYDGEPLPA
jgi:integrase/recombinase XerD